MLARITIPCTLSVGTELGTMPEAGVIQDMGLQVIGNPGISNEHSRQDGDPQQEVGTPPSANSKETVVTPQQPLVLSEGLAPVPAKLVDKIIRGDFVDMAELLRDNLEVQRRGSGQEEVASTAQPKKGRREIPDLLSWVQCFGTYMAVVASKRPDRVRELLAYQTLIVREARRCGGKGWMEYDRYFRQQVVGNAAV